jgi:hypothetical protein
VDSTTLLGFIVGVLIIGVLLIAVMALTKKGTRLDVEKYRMRWLSIETQLKRDNVSSYHLCVLNADKLVDHALKECGIKGTTMGDRMKSARETWSNATALWAAHKLRNQIAHETDARVGYDDARRALAGFKQALKDLGAI